MACPRTMNVKVWNFHTHGREEIAFSPTWPWDDEKKSLYGRINSAIMLLQYKFHSEFWQFILCPILWPFVFFINLDYQKMMNWIRRRKQKPMPVAPFSLDIWLDVAEFLDLESRQSTLLLACSQLSDSIQQRIEQRLWHSEKEMIAAGDLRKDRRLLLYRANLVKLLGRRNLFLKSRLRLVEDVSDGWGQRGDAILIAAKYIPLALAEAQGIINNDNTMNNRIRTDKKANGNIRRFEHRVLITSGKLMRGESKWNSYPYSCQIEGYTFMLKCWMRATNKIDKCVFGPEINGPIPQWRITQNSGTQISRLLPPHKVYESRFRRDDFTAVCKSKCSMKCAKPKIWDTVTYDICREVEHCMPMIGNACPKHFMRKYSYEPNCGNECQERIRDYKKLEAEASANVTTNAWKWTNNLPTCIYYRDLDYNHRTYLTRHDCHMDVDEAAGLVHYEVDFSRSHSMWISSGIRPLNKKGIQLLARYASDFDLRKPSIESTSFSRIIEFPTEIDEESIKCHWSPKNSDFLVIEANLKEKGI